MAGPNSVPAGDQQLYERLRQFVCEKHKDCYGEKGNSCSMIVRRELLLRTNRLVTGKTK